MNSTDLAAHAERLRSLHVPGRPVVLPNAWDVSSAQTFESAGFPALATSSSAVARSLGYEDGEETPADEMFAAVRRIAAAVSAPLTADVERGYGLDPSSLVERLIGAGAVGCNLEDSDPASGEMIAAGAQATWLREVVGAAEKAGVRLVVNARIDLHLREWGEADRRMASAVERGNAYLDAGASCVYPIGLSSIADVEAFASAVDGPVNIVFRPNGPSMTDLARVGVARISFGGGLHQASVHVLRGMADRIKAGENPYAAL